MASARDLDDEEGDLFGSDDEGTAPPAAPAAPAAAAPGASAGNDAEVDEKDLFGSGEEDDVSEKDLFGSEEEGDELDERELFGSDTEGSRKDKAEKGLPSSGTPLAAPSEISEMDERDIFGEVPEDEEEPEKVEDVILLRRPGPPTDRVMKSMRLPNVLSVDTKPYKEETVPQSLLEGYKEFKNTRGQNVVKLLNPENCVRWRFKKGPDGQILTDDDGRPQYESNSRLVEWEDGSRTLFVGGEAFNISEIGDRTFLYEENSKDVYVCHGSLKKKLVATPRSLNSSTHEMLKRSQYRKYEPVRRSLLMAIDEGVSAERQLQDIANEDKKRKEKKKATDMSSGGMATMSGAFLEDEEDGGEGPSVAGLKKQFKQAGAQPVKRLKLDNES